MEDSSSSSPITSLERLILWAQTYQEKAAMKSAQTWNFLLQSWLTKYVIFVRSSWQIGYKCVIGIHESCRGDVYLPLETNLIWFGGLELHIHFFKIGPQLACIYQRKRGWLGIRCCQHHWN